MTPSHRRVLNALLTQPTAPFVEGRVVQAVEEVAEASLARRRGPTGNVWLDHRPQDAGPRWVLAAHLDHPGFVATRRRGRTLWAEFRGGVAREYFPGSAVRFFPADADSAGVPGRVVSVRRSGSSPFLTCRIELDGSPDVPPGSPGMWDLPAIEWVDGRIRSRACDDLAGAAAIVCAMNELARRDAPVKVSALLTRGEEAGFVGALAACADGELGPGDRVVGVEASKERPGAELGDGVVVRVGDRTTIFDPEVTACLVSVASRLARRSRSFASTRQLMPGGTCESTVYCAWGMPAGALCLPLGNYHNQGADGAIAAEEVHAGDFDCLVRLLAGVVEQPPPDVDGPSPLRRRLEELLAQRRRYLDR